MLRAQVDTDAGESFVVEVVAYAILTTKVKIAVNAEQIAGDAFWKKMKKRAGHTRPGAFLPGR